MTQITAVLLSILCLSSYDSMDATESRTMKTRKDGYFYV